MTPGKYRSILEKEQRRGDPNSVYKLGLNLQVTSEQQGYERKTEMRSELLSKGQCLQSELEANTSAKIIKSVLFELI